MKGSRVRRKLVQSTLFPHRASSIKEPSICNANEIDDDYVDRDETDEEEEEEEDEEFCNQSNKRKGKQRKWNPKAKTTPQQKSRASSKLMQATENGKEVSRAQEDDGNSPITVKSDFFIKASQRRKQKALVKEMVSTDAPEERKEAGSLPAHSKDMSSQRKPKRRANSTPKKERINSTPKKRMSCGPIELCSEQTLCITLDQQSMRSVPNLRLEAKLTAEENSRIFSGKEIHPFFKSWKTGKPSQETNSESTWLSTEIKEKGLTFTPIHVFEIAEDGGITIDWGRWTFSEGSSVCSSVGQEYECSPIAEGRVNYLHFDNFLTVSRFTNILPYQENTAMDQCSLPGEEEHTSKAIGSFTRNSGFTNPDDELQDRLLQERIMSNCHSSRNQCENCLWIDKYQPQNAMQVCGNGEAVKFLSEWLHLWQRKGSQTSGSSTVKNTSVVQDLDYDRSQCDCDSDAIDDGESLKNVLLVTGPVGSGKSAAIYACAKEQGFQIIEINTSDWRNGAMVKQKFGEAVESHRQKRAAEHPTSSDCRPLANSVQAVMESQSSDNEVIELVPLSDNAELLDGAKPHRSTCEENRTAYDQNEIKTLILFEDVDATLCEDHGFLSTIQQLAETAKRPMILTSNSNNPVLPRSLDRLELSFTMPSVEELFELVRTVCAAEDTVMDPCLVERFINYCQGDIRKTFMHLQFWRQGQVPSKGDELQMTYNPLLFDLDAGHQILPKIIPWSWPSRLSELVEEEVIKSLNFVEESQRLREIVQEDWINGKETGNACVEESESPMMAEREAMLNLHSSVQEHDNHGQFEANHECSDSFPMAFNRRNGRRRIAAILSDSEEEYCGTRIGSDFTEMFDDENSEAFKTESISTFNSLCFDNCQHPPEQSSQSEVQNSEKSCMLTERDNGSLTDYACRSVDDSRILEPLIVPNMDIMNGQLFSAPVYYSHLPNTVHQLEENCFPLSEKVDDFLMDFKWKSPDTVCGTEPAFVSNTWFTNEELFSTDTCYGHFVNGVEPQFIIQDLLPNLEGLNGENPHQCCKTMNYDGEVSENSYDTRPALHDLKDIGGSSSGHEQDTPNEYHVLDRCSSLDVKRSFKFLESSEALCVINPVQETWKNLREQSREFKQYITSEEKMAVQASELAYGICNLISEADLLLRECQATVCDSLEPSMIPSERSHSYSFYDDQLQISSIFAQHGMCFYAKESVALGSTMGSLSKVDLASEMLASSSSSMALGKLASQDKRNIETLGVKPPRGGCSFRSKATSCLRNILQSIVPPKSYLTVNGQSLHEYLSSLSHISRLEDLRLSECIDKRKQRRSRVARHYLSSGSLGLTAEEVSLLSQYNSYQRVSSLPNN